MRVFVDYRTPTKELVSDRKQHLSLQLPEVKLAAAHPAVELRGMLRAAALVSLVFKTARKHVGLLSRMILPQNT
jgi:hypothetical protein